MKFYISCTSSQVFRARAFAKKLRDLGHTVVSTWHDLEKPIAPNIMPWAEKLKKYNWPEIESCDMLVALQPGELVSGGMFVEVGYAIRAFKDVAVIGTALNPLMEDYQCTHFLFEEGFFQKIPKS